jgi:hypothetical protein
VHYCFPDSAHQIYDVILTLSTGDGGIGFAETEPGTVGSASNASAMDFPTKDVAGATLGVDHLGGGHQLQAVITYWQGTVPATLGYFWSSSAAPFRNSWHGPFKITDGENARLASGPEGLFLLSQDYTSPNEGEPTRLSVRKWDATTHGFGAPTTVVNDANNDDANQIGGLAEDAATGSLYVAWPSPAVGDANPVMRLWTSSDGGVSFSAPREIAPIDGALEAGITRMAVTHGDGFLTFLDEGGLHLSDILPAAS